MTEKAEKAEDQVVKITITLTNPAASPEDVNLSTDIAFGGDVKSEGFAACVLAFNDTLKPMLKPILDASYNAGLQHADKIKMQSAITSLQAQLSQTQADLAALQDKAVIPLPVKPTRRRKTDS